MFRRGGRRRRKEEEGNYKLLLCQTTTICVSLKECSERSFAIPCLVLFGMDEPHLRGARIDTPNVQHKAPPDR